MFLYYSLIKKEFHQFLRDSLALLCKWPEDVLRVFPKLVGINASCNYIFFQSKDCLQQDATHKRIILYIVTYNHGHNIFETLMFDQTLFSPQVKKA